MVGLIVKKLADLFTVYAGGKEVKAHARGNLKKDDESLYVGDFVLLSKTEQGEYVIESVRERKNLLTRPPISNLDNLVIVITNVPEPDLFLVDKLIVKCFMQNIKPIIVISKADILPDDFTNQILQDYKNVVKDIVITSSLNGQGKEDLIKLLKNKTSSLVGQSAVGKSSIINMLGGNAQVGDVGKNLRGKNTTRHSQINIFDGNIRIADTSGFSRFYINDINYKNLMRFYPDFVRYSDKCKYASCVHINEKDNECFVKSAVKSGKISINRYTRYVEIYNELKKQWDRRYD